VVISMLLLLGLGGGRRRPALGNQLSSPALVGSSGAILSYHVQGHEPNFFAVILAVSAARWRAPAAGAAAGQTRLGRGAAFI
jgi:NAD/NADP transhydrogenase beta subunit